jgi:propanol-preferring alcohol dehydrogenase
MRSNIMKMLAARVLEFGKPLSVIDLDVPEPGEGQVLVKIAASGVCHTDIHAADGDWPVRPTLPFTPGHEGVGMVAAVGTGVRILKEGDRVGIPWLHSACGVCDYCVNGWETLCPKQQNTGYSVDGGYAEYALAPAAFAALLPDSLGFVEAAPILCAGVTTYKALKESEVKPGQWVVISGIGGLGHVAVQYARAMGMRVVALDRHDEKLDLARECGAEIAINVSTQDAVAEIQRSIGGAHGAVVTAVSPEAFSQVIGTLRSGGTCALVGLPPGTFETPIFEMVLKRLTIRGSIVGTRTDLREALTFAERGHIESRIEVQPLGAINDIFTRLKAGQIQGRVVLQMS